MLRRVKTFPLFTIAGVPVSASPWYLLLLYMFARGDLLRGVIWACGITLGLLVHELGHALVARYLRHNPSITLHGFGGLTSRERSGRDVEEAAIIAAGPAAGLLLALVIWGLWQVTIHVLATPDGQVAFPRAVYEGFQAVLMPSVTWNILNLIPLWPLDGGQLFRLVAMRVVGARRADGVTHRLALGLLATAALFLWWRGGIDMYTIVLLAMLAGQNVRALRGEASSGIVQPTHAYAGEQLVSAREALTQGRFKEAARLAQQARTHSQLGAPALDEIWEILGLANTELGEHEEALSYLRRAKPTPAVQQATAICLHELGRDDEQPEIAARWQTGARGRHMGRFLLGVLAFLVVAITFVFSTRLSMFFL